MKDMSEEKMFKVEKPKEFWKRMEDKYLGWEVSQDFDDGSIVLTFRKNVKCFTLKIN